MGWFAAPAGRRLLALVTVALLLGTTGYAVVVRGHLLGAQAGSAAILTVFLGAAEVETPSAAAFQPAHTGDQVADGSSIRTQAGSKAALTFPDGSITRLDALTTLKVVSIPHGPGTTALFQAAGETWNSVRQLGAGSHYRVRGPNNSTAEVRGTEFTFMVGGDQGDRLDVWSGAVDLSAAGATVAVTGGQTAAVPTATAPPSSPEPISASDRRSSFVVFNQTLDATATTPTHVHGDSATPGLVSVPVTAASSDGDTDLDFSLGWPGSTFELDVLAPDGSVYAARSSSKPPVSVVVKAAAKGVWSYQVKDLESDPLEAWWVIVSKLPGHGAESQPSSPAKADAKSTNIKPTPAPALSPSAGSSTKPLEATPTPAIDPTPSSEPTPSSDSTDAGSTGDSGPGGGPGSGEPGAVRGPPGGPGPRGPTPAHPPPGGPGAGGPGGGPGNGGPGNGGPGSGGPTGSGNPGGGGSGPGGGGTAPGGGGTPPKKAEVQVPAARH